MFASVFSFNLFGAIDTFLILFFAIDSHYFSQSSQLQHFFAFLPPSHSFLVSHFVAICRQTLLDWPMARTFPFLGDSLRTLPSVDDLCDAALFSHSNQLFASAFFSSFLPVVPSKLALYLFGAININNIEIVFKNTLAVSFSVFFF